MVIPTRVPVVPAHPYNYYDYYDYYNCNNCGTLSGQELVSIIIGACFVIFVPALCNTLLDEYSPLSPGASFAISLLILPVSILFYGYIHAQMFW